MAASANRPTKAAARRMYEEEGASFAAIGREVEFSAASVSKWAEQEGWVKGSGLPKVADVAEEIEAVEAQIDDEFHVPSDSISAREESEQELRERLEVLEARNADLQAENEKLRPTTDVSEMFKDRVKWLTDNSPEGERYWLNRAEAKFKKDNRERARDGLPVFNVKEHPEILEDLINELQTKEMADRGEPDEPAARKVKLFIMRNGMPTIEQIPMENQINNMKGSLADGIIRYTRKGFKLTDPFLCPRAGCFKPAESDELQRWQYDGYCTERHRTEVEGDEKSPTIGLKTRDTVLSGIS